MSPSSRSATCTIQANETLSFFIGQQKSFCSSYTAHKGNLSILHSYSFQVPLFFLRKVTTRRVCVIYTLWARSMTNDATAGGSVSVPKLGKSMILAIPVRTVWQTILLLGVFCNTPTWKFQSVILIPTTYIVYASGTRTPVQKVAKPLRKSVMTVDIYILDQQVEAEISSTLRWTYLSNDIGKVVFEKLIVIQPILVAVRSKM